jgi:hypothetical protein
MEQKDYLLREIEKIGLLLRMILNKLVGKQENFAVQIERQFEETNELLLNEAGFDLEKFLSLENSEIEQYLSKFEGIKGLNIELFADILKEFGMRTKSVKNKEFLDKALKLYELCSSKDKTFSFEREAKIGEVITTLKKKELL